MSDMKRFITRAAGVAAVIFAAVLTSCAGRYQELPFGGMNGRVQKVTVWHHMPEMWYAGESGTDVMYVNSSAYDIRGNEICSAVMDSAQRIQAETENVWEAGVCARSIQKQNGRVVARLQLNVRKGNMLVYNKVVNGETVQMTVKETRMGRRYKSEVSEDGKLVMTSVIVTDRDGYPLKITTDNIQTGVQTVETNIFDENHNVIEKHVKSSDNPVEDITYTVYGDLDEHGNWKDARTYNRLRLPSEVIFRDFEYWD